MALAKKTLADYPDWVDLATALQAPSAKGAVIYQVLQFDSSLAGSQQAIIFGDPGLGKFTTSTPDEAIAKYPQLGTQPSNLAYPVAYIEKE
jgi:hypothetical protein